MISEKEYILNLRDMEVGAYEFRFTLDDAFFGGLDGAMFAKGNVDAEVTVRRVDDSFYIDMRMKGMVVVPCDRCLDDMEQEIEAEGHIDARFGNEESDDDNIVVVREKEGELDLSWYMYEYIALAVPIRHVHAEGECNEEMAKRLGEHICYTEDGEDDENSGSERLASTNRAGRGTDPRWEALKNIKLE